MVKIKQIGKTLNVFVNGSTFSIENIDAELQQRIYKYAVLYNRTGNEYAKARLLELVDKKTTQAEAERMKLRAEKKRLEHQQTTIHPSLSKYFRVKDNALQIKGIDINFPLSYVKVLNDTVAKGYNPIAVKNFLQLLALNPSKYIRDNLFDFFVANHFPITENGYIGALRRVWLKSDAGVVVDRKREQILSAYNIVKVRKKSPAKFYLGEDGKPTQTPNGKTLEELKSELGEASTTTWYTDNYTKTFRWQLQTVCDKPRGESVGHEDSNCSGGFFHLGSKDHVLRNPGYGNVILLCLVNPMNCTNIPHGQTWKFGTCEFFPVAEIDEKEVEEIFQNPFDVIGTIDEAYERLEFFNIPVGVEFTISENARIIAINKKLLELREQTSWFGGQVTEFGELEKIVQQRVIEI